MSSAELDFFSQIVHQICLVFRKFLSLNVHIRNNLKKKAFSQPVNDAYVKTMQIAR